LCFTVSIGVSLEKILPGLWIIIYSCFYAILYLTGKLWFDDVETAWQKPFRNYGILGTTILSYLLTFEWVWKDIGCEFYRTGGKFHVEAAFMDYFILAALVVPAIALFVRAFREKRYLQCAFACMPILSILCYSFSSFGANPFVPVWIYNVYVLALGIICVVIGMRDKKLGLTNVGIFIMGIIIFTRFVDASLGIIVRGLVFIAIGICFILVNTILSKKFKVEEITNE